jgi:hypothetical protein
MLTKTMIALSTAIVVAASATPAMSASKKARHHVAAPQQAYAQFTETDRRRHSSNRAYDVYINGRYAGSDPDPTVRAMLYRDPPWAY